jgi:predicted small metal-binding protein
VTAAAHPREEALMEKVVKCGDLFPGCQAEARGETDDEVLRRAAEHARAAHGVEKVDEATAAKVKAAIRPRG